MLYFNLVNQNNHYMNCMFLQVSYSLTIIANQRMDKIETYLTMRKYVNF